MWRNEHLALLKEVFCSNEKLAWYEYLGCWSNRKRKNFLVACTVSEKNTITLLYLEFYVTTALS